MAKLIISNQRTEEMVGNLALLDPEYLRYVGNQGMRMAWCLSPGDVLVLPIAANEQFIQYVTAQLDIDRNSVEVVIPPSGRMGDSALSRDRMANREFIAELQSHIADKDIDQILPFHFDSSVAALACELGLDSTTPGFGLLEQRGGELLNSKQTFRAIAGGTGAPIPEGTVVSTVQDAEEFLWERLLSKGSPAILKQNFHVASYGNEIVSPFSGVHPLGAHQSVVATTRDELNEYLSGRWSWLSDDGKNSVIIEQYVPESLPIYAELRVEDHGVELTGHGGMRMKPVLNGIIVPAPPCDHSEFSRFLLAARRLCEPLHAMGYRGIVSVDAIVTPSQEILINEFNCRVGGSTHIHQIGENIVGDDYFESRVMVELRRCTFPRFEKALDLLIENGLAYDPISRTGVLLTVADDDSSGYGEYCVVAYSSDQSAEFEESVAKLFSSAGKE